MVTASVIRGKAAAGAMVWTPLPEISNSMVSAPEVALALSIACLREPAPMSLVFLTVKVVSAWAGSAAIISDAAIRASNTPSVRIFLLPATTPFCVVCIIFRVPFFSWCSNLSNYCVVSSVAPLRPLSTLSMPSANRPLVDGVLRDPVRRVLLPVADVLAREVVVAAVHLFQAKPVQVHRHRGLAVRVPDPVDAPVAGEHRGGAVFGAPGKSPGLFEAGVFRYGAVVEALVAFLEDGSRGAGVGAPGGVVVDPGLGPRGPGEDLEGERAVGGVPAMGHVPPLRTPRLFEDGQDVGAQERTVAYQVREERRRAWQGPYRW